MITWVLPRCLQEKSPKERHISTWRFELYVPAEHRPLMAHIAQDLGVSALVIRSIALWMLGYAETALADAEKRSRTHARSVMLLL